MVLRRDFLAGAAAWGTLASIGAASAAVVTGSAREAVIADFLKQQPFYGVIAIAKAGKPLFSQVLGLADIEAKRATTLQTPYAIASISKWLTTLAVLKLCTAGTLDLDAPITRYLPAYRADTGAKITLRRLLSNTSGVPNGYSAAVKADPTLVTSTLSAQEVVKRWGMGDFAFAPGTKFDYSMTNWIIIVAIVEAVTGKRFAETMSELVLTPLGMRHTTLDNPADVAIGYRSVEPLERHMEERPIFTAAAGGYYSTAEDLVAAAHKVFDGGFLAPARQSEMLRVQWAEQDYALGGRVKMRFVDGMPRVFAWETGRTAGYRSVLGHRFDDQTTIVLLNNTGLSQKVMDEFAIALFGAV